MKRDNNGRFPKGQSGNLKGRPRKKKRPITNRQMRTDLWLAMEEEMAMTIGEKKKKLPIMLFIYKQLLRKAAKGDVRCMFKAVDLRSQLIAEHSAAQGDAVETVIRADKYIAEHPDDITDLELKIIENMRKRAWDPTKVN